MGVSEYRKWKRNQIEGDPYLSVVIPTYNEEVRIVPTIGAIANHVSSLGFDWELVVSDDGSTDATLELVRDLELVNMVIIEATHNTGKGGAVRRGVAASQGEFILFADADQSTPIEQIGAFIDKIESEGLDIVIGSRSAGGADVANKSFVRTLLSAGLNKIVRAAFGLRFKDTQCGFKLFRSDVGKKIFSVASIDGFSFDLELLYIAQKAGLGVAELPVQWHDAPDSKVSGGRVALRFLADMPIIILNHLRGRYSLKD